MYRGLLIVAALGAAGTVEAQTTTQCTGLPGMVTCNTAPDMQAMMQNRGHAPPADWRSVPPKPCNALERFGNSDNYLCEARQIAANRKAVGDLIAEGRCDEALKGALATGDMEYAREVRDFCSAPKP